MRLRTPRLLIRPLRLADAQSLVKQGHEKLMPYFTWYIPFPFTLLKAKKVISWLQKESRKKIEGDRTYAFAISIKATGELIGVTDLYDVHLKDKKGKIGYWIGKEHRGKGLASEAVQAMLGFAFDTLGLRKVIAETVADNTSSNKLLKRAGFRRVGIMKKDRVIEGKARDIVLWERLTVGL